RTSPVTTAGFVVRWGSERARPGKSRHILMITLLAATGFTGQLIARALHRSGLPLRLAARSEAKLRELAAQVGDPPIVVADLMQPETLGAAFDETKVLITCAGEFITWTRRASSTSSNSSLINTHRRRANAARHSCQARLLSTRSGMPPRYSPAGIWKSATKSPSPTTSKASAPVAARKNQSSMRSATPVFFTAT